MEGIESKIKDLNLVQDSGAPASSFPKKPLVIIVLGMAGSGKTTFVQRLVSHLTEHKKRTYCINLDPAVLEVNFPANIDIRDSVKYKTVMKEYKLGPNGAILTCLNFFAAQFDQVVKMIEAKESEIDYVVIDTPGQIEAFSQSASGQIVTETLACTFPTMNLYVADTVRCENPNTFMSNMFYALSILYKSKIPLLLCFNKTDIIDHSFAMQWMSDFDTFDQNLAKVDTYLSSLSRSLSLVLEEFYKNIEACGVSAHLGKGFDKLDGKFENCRKEYYDVFYKEIQQRLKDKEEK